MSRPRSEDPRDSIVSVRLTARERNEMEATAAALGSRSLSEYLRSLQQEKAPPQQAVPPKEHATRAKRPKIFHRTSLGKVLHGNALGYLFRQAERKSVDLIMTSPPFGLVKKKSYGN